MHELMSADGRFAVTLLELVEQKMVHLAEAAWPEETGGILVGYYSTDLRTGRITEALAPPADSERSRWRFSRGVRGLTAKLRSLWRKPKAHRQYYLGEWHSHPDGPIAMSSRDRATMRRIAEEVKYQCPEPLLVILGGSPEAGWNLGCWAFVRNRGYVELR